MPCNLITSDNFGANDKESKGHFRIYQLDNLFKGYLVDVYQVVVCSVQFLNASVKWRSMRNWTKRSECERLNDLEKRFKLNYVPFCRDRAVFFGAAQRIHSWKLCCVSIFVRVSLYCSVFWRKKTNCSLESETNGLSCDALELPHCSHIQLENDDEMMVY